MTLKRKAEMKRTRIKRREPKRIWDKAREKLEREGCCRLCGCTRDLQAAHTIPKAMSDVRIEGPKGGVYLLVPEDATVPLCGDFGEGCHGLHDRHEVDLLPVLTLAEQVFAV